MTGVGYQLVSEFPQYCVGTDGSVWSHQWGYWHRMVPKPLKNRYLLVLLCDRSRRCYYLVHRLVLETFVGPCPVGMETRHLNRVRHDNRLSNLRWGTKGDNQDDREHHGTVLRGEHHGMAKLTVKQVQQIRRLKPFFAAKDVAQMKGVSTSTVNQIWRGVIWKSV